MSDAPDYSQALERFDPDDFHEVGKRLEHVDSILALQRIKARLAASQAREEELRIAANPELACVPSDEEMYRIVTTGIERERIELSTALRVLVSRVRHALAAPTDSTEEPLSPEAVERLLADMRLDAAAPTDSTEEDE